MNWSWKIARLAGIDVFLHWTFPLLMGWVLFSQLAIGADWFAAWMHLAFVLSIFGCVLLHELGHALAAREFGISTRDITLLPIGGVAHLERIPERPWHEFVIAIGGPLVNMVIAAAIFVGLVLVDAGKLWFGEIATGYFWQDLMWASRWFCST